MTKPQCPTWSFVIGNSLGILVWALVILTSQDYPKIIPRTMLRSDQGVGSRARWIIGGFFVALVWTLYFVRLICGTGPMHDDAGVQAPLMHYLYGALAVTGMVVVWIVGMAIRKTDEENK